MIIFFQLTLAILSLGFLSFPLSVESKTHASTDKIKAASFHDCKGACEAKKAMIMAIKGQKKLKVAHESCDEELKGTVRFKKINGRERGICYFKDGSSVELKDLQKLSDSKYK